MRILIFKRHGYDIIIREFIKTELRKFLIRHLLSFYPTGTSEVLFVCDGERSLQTGIFYISGRDYRLAQFSKDVLKIPVSTGTLVNIVQKSAQDLDASMNFIKEQLKSAPVVHFDETGTRVDGKTI